MTIIWLAWLKLWPLYCTDRVVRLLVRVQSLTVLGACGGEGVCVYVCECLHVCVCVCEWVYTCVCVCVCTVCVCVHVCVWGGGTHSGCDVTMDYCTSYVVMLLSNQNLKLLATTVATALWIWLQVILERNGDFFVRKFGCCENEVVCSWTCFQTDLKPAHDWVWSSIKGTSNSRRRLDAPLVA